MSRCAGRRVAVLVFGTALAAGCPSGGPGAPDDAGAEGDVPTEAEGDGATEAEAVDEAGEPDEAEADVPGEGDGGAEADDGGAAPCDLEPDAGGRVVVAAAVTCIDRTILLPAEATVLVAGGGSLRLIRSTLGVRGDVTIAEGGALRLEEASALAVLDDPNLGHVNEARHRRLRVEAGGVLEAENSSLCAANNGDDEHPSCEPPALDLTCTNFDPVVDECATMPEGDLLCSRFDDDAHPELRYFEFALEGRATLTNSLVTFAGIARDDEGQAFWNQSWVTEKAKQDQQVMSGIVVHPGAGLALTGSRVSHSELHGVYVYEDFQNLGDGLGELIELGVPLMDVTIDDSEFSYNGLGVWCHPLAGGIGLVVVDARLIQPYGFDPEAEGTWVPEDYPLDPCRACDPEDRFARETESSFFGTRDDAEDVEAYFSDWDSPVFVENLHPVLRAVVTYCLVRHPDNAVEQAICMEEQWPDGLALAVDRTTFHHNAQGGMSLQSVFTKPLIKRCDFFCNGTDYKDIYGGCDGAADAAMDQLYRAAYDVATRNDVYRGDPQLDGDNFFVAYSKAFGPSLRRHASYGVFSVFMQAGLFEDNTVHHNTGWGMHHSKGGSWLVRGSEFFQNRTGFGAGCPASRLAFAENVVRDNGLGFYVHFSGITGAGFWTEMRDNAIEENGIGMVVWSAPPMNVRLRGGFLLRGNDAWGMLLMRASWVNFLGGSADYSPVDWICESADVRIEGNDVHVAGPVEVRAGCSFTLTGVADWTRVQHMPRVGACDTEALPFVDALGRDASGDLTLDGTTLDALHTTCRDWLPTFCRAADAACHEANPIYPLCCDRSDAACRAAYADAAECPDEFWPPHT